MRPWRGMHYLEVVRPDQYVAHVPSLNGHRPLAAFFDAHDANGRLAPIDAFQLPGKFGKPVVHAEPRLPAP